MPYLFLNTGRGQAGTPLIEPDMQISRIRHSSDKTSRLHTHDGPCSLQLWWLLWIRIDEHAVRRIRFRGPEPRIEAEPRPAIGAEDRVLLAHVNVDVRVIVRRRNADTVEFPDADSDLRDRAVVPELRIAATGHGFRPL